jgi:hypothetical protein
MGNCLGKKNKTDSQNFNEFIKNNVNIDKIGKIATFMYNKVHKNIQNDEATENIFELTLILDSVFKDTNDYGSSLFNQMTKEQFNNYRGSLEKACSMLLDMETKYIILILNRFEKYAENCKKDTNTGSNRSNQLIKLKKLVEFINDECKNNPNFYKNGQYIHTHNQGFNGLLSQLVLYESLLKIETIPDYDKLVSMKQRNKVTKAQFEFMKSSFQKAVINIWKFEGIEVEKAMENYESLRDYLLAKFVSSFL